MPVSPHSTRVPPLLLSGYHGVSMPGTVSIHGSDGRQRVQRALGGFARWWSAALVSVFIAVAPFVLVPSFVRCGGGQFFQRLGTTALATPARGHVSGLRRDRNA